MLVLRHSLIGLVALTCAVGCGRDTPSAPTWVDDVRPILMANCVRCHGYPATGGAPDSFRLDVYDDWTAPNGRVLRGAGAMAEYIKIRTEEHEMPPRFPLDDRQIDILASWRATGSEGVAPAKGTPRRSNGAPTVMLLGLLADSVTPDGSLAIQYEIRDPDRDNVVGELRVGTTDAASAVVVDRSVHSGRGIAMWNASTFAPGTYKLFWVLDDGGDTSTHEVGNYEVAHANTAPSVRVTAPALYDIIADQDLPYDITMELADPDPGLGLKVTIEAVRGNDRVMLGTPAMDANVGTYTFQLTDTTNLPEGPGWRLEISVTDGETTTNARTGPFVIGHRTTTDGYGTVQIFGFCIKCHPGDGASPDLAIPGLNISFGEFQNVTNDAGMLDIMGDVRRLRGLIYRRTVQLRNMPPKSAQIHGGRLGDPSKPSQEQIQQLENWLLSGTPEFPP